MSKPRYSGNNQGGLADLIDAMGEAHNTRVKAETDLKTAILKHAYEKQMDAKMADEERAKQEMEKDPAQAYLKRRYQEENPLMGLNSTASDMQVQPNELGGVTTITPATAVQPVMGVSGEKGTYQETPVGDEQAKGAFMQKVGAALASGRQVHPAVKAMYDNFSAPKATGMSLDTSTPEGRQAFLKSLPEEQQALVNGLGDYSLDLSKISSLRNNDREKLTGITKRVFPEFDMKQYEARKKFMDDVMDSSSTGSFGSKSLSMNTLIGHLGELKNDMTVLNNTGSPPANAVINLAKQLTGDSSITDYKLAKTNVESEIENLLTASGVTQQGLAHRLSILPDNASKQAMDDYLKTIGRTIAVRGNAMEGVFKTRLGKDAGNYVYNPGSRESLQSIMKGGNGENDIKSGAGSDKDFSHLWS